VPDEDNLRRDSNTSGVLPTLDDSRQLLQYSCLLGKLSAVARDPDADVNILGSDAY
jgi:hypothetical protein